MPARDHERVRNAGCCELHARKIADLDRLVDQFNTVDRILIGTSKAFDFGDDSNTPRFAYIGPQIDDVAWADEWASPWPDRKAKRQRVLVSFSTTFQPT